MNIFHRLVSRSLRFKIIFGLLLSLLPMLAIMGISYTSARHSALQTSERILKLINHNGAKEINGFIKAQEAVFSDWTREDVFGMAIEFETTGELQSHLMSLLKGQKGFSLIMVVDKSGKVLEAAAGEHLTTTDADAFKGRIVKEPAAFANGSDRSAVLVQTDFMKQLGQKYTATYLFSFQTKNSEGKPNGFFLAYLDWHHLQSTVDSVSSELKTNGYGNAKAAIMDTASKTALGHSNAEMIGSSLKMEDSIMSWLRDANQGTVRRFDLRKGTNYVTFAPLIRPAALFNTETRTAASGLHLIGFVPEGDILSTVRRILWTSSAIAGGGGILIVLIGLIIAGMICKPLNRISEGLNEGADQVASASGQVSSASQSLAEGSSEQAASIEETSSSLEEMSSMTNQNADNAGQADNLMKEANHMVSQANQSMGELTASMGEISKASEETSKIIKTIDEIAFQTNLLALNAAVEAARAGEAGAGFAVVADEVRNLAMRAAEAAKNTASLIDGTVKKIDDGSALVTRTNTAFDQMAQSASRVGELVAEIAAASKEQSQGIEQVNTAVNQMDKVTQQNAASAEESASAAEEMFAQAQQMKKIVTELVVLVSGSDQAVGQELESEIEAPKIKIQDEMAVAATVKKSESTSLAMDQAKEVSPEQVIPLDDEDFKDF